MIEYVDLAQAREAPGVRIAVNALVPSPWSEAAKAVFRIANVPVLAVRKTREATADINAWICADNVPAVLHGAEPVRTSWSAIVGLAARLGEHVLPTDIAARAEMMGALDLVAGEDGLGWNGRLAMIDASVATGTGFAAPVAAYLARRYSYVPGMLPAVRARVAAQLGVLHDRLDAQQARGHAYFGGDHVSALDVYLATFLTPLFPITDDVCPQVSAAMRGAFAHAAAAFGPLISPELAAHRQLIFARHLELPIPL